MKTKKDECSYSFSNAIRTLVMVRETGLEPACPKRTLEPESSASANSAIPADVMVGRGGFEPPKSLTADLQSAPFGHSGTYPHLMPFPLKLKWSWRRDLNPQPADYKSAALPIELRQPVQETGCHTSPAASTSNPPLRRQQILLYMVSMICQVVYLNFLIFYSRNLPCPASSIFDWAGRERSVFMIQCK